MNSNIELKHCPFCGGQAEFVTSTSGYQNDSRIIGFAIKCNRCIVVYPKRYEIRISLNSRGLIEADIDQRNQAVSDWNTRQGA